MKTLILIIAVVFALVITGCNTMNGGLLRNENLSEKEKARRAAAAMHGDNKPYVYRWSEDRGDYILHGQALVVPDGSER